MSIKYCSSVICVKEMQKSRQFYEGLLGQKVELDHGECVGFIGGFSLWQEDHASRILFGRDGAIRFMHDDHRGEMYFETDDLDGALAIVSRSGARFVHDLVEQPWGQRVFRVYDPDGHIVEIGEPVNAVIKRFLKLGMTIEEVAQRTSMPPETVKAAADEIHSPW